MFNPYFISTRNRTLKQVFNGDFPGEALKKMNRRCLEKFVLKLVECSSDAGAKGTKDFTGLYKSLCLKEMNKPEWWPSEGIISQSLTSDGKYVMDLLRFLVYKCCEFFKKPSENLNNKIFVTENDENCRGVKRKYSDISVNNIPCKRRTLMPKNLPSKSESSADVFAENILLKNPFISLKDIFYKPKPLTQDAFLNIFGLQNTLNHNTDDSPDSLIIPSTSIKFNTCSVIPFSSDLGLELMKRDNHICPEALKSRRLERLEWYVNKPFSHYSELKYDVSYQEKKDLIFRSYKFPKRQIWQHPGDVNFQKKALCCRRLTVVLLRQNLNAMQKELKKKPQQKLCFVPRILVKPPRSVKYSKKKGAKCVNKKKKM